jgi:hypothetical protein
MVAFGSGGRAVNVLEVGVEGEEVVVVAPFVQEIRCDPRVVVVGWWSEYWWWCGGWL